jgi:abequosyltransferase
MRIDILIPTYQRVDSLLQNLEHILARMRAELVEEHFRIIVSDNASLDRTESAVRALMASVNSGRDLLTYHRNDENLGLEGNAVRVASLATAEFVLWCGDDDFFADGYLRYLVDSIAARPLLGCVIPGLASLHHDGSVGVGRDEGLGARAFSGGYLAVHELSHLAHQMSGLLLRREGMLHDYLAKPELRNPYLFIYFAANRLLRYEGIYAPMYKTRVTVFNEKAWGYNSIGLLDEVFKNYLALLPACTQREVDELILRFVLMHSYRLAFRPLRPAVLGKQFVGVWKAGSSTLYLKRRMGVLFLREIASSVLR